MVQSIQAVSQATNQVPVEPVQGGRSSRPDQARSVQMQEDKNLKTDEANYMKGLDRQGEARSSEQKIMDREQQQDFENVKSVRGWDVMA